jgi:hypothetical protein
MQRQCGLDDGGLKSPLGQLVSTNQGDGFVTILSGWSLKYLSMNSVNTVSSDLGNIFYNLNKTFYKQKTWVSTSFITQVLIIK